MKKTAGHDTLEAGAESDLVAADAAANGGDEAASQDLDEPALEIDPRTEILEAVFNTWINERVHGTPLSQATEAYNHLQGALPDLKLAILKAL